MSHATTSRTPAVLHLISSLKVGGAERLLVSTMGVARGHPALCFVIVVMNEAVDPGLMSELRASGFPVYHLARPEGHLHPRYLIEILRIVRRHNVKVVHTHNDGSRLWGMLTKVARPSLKLVYTQHEQGGALSICGLQRLAYRALVDMTVAISPAVAREMRPVAAGHISLIENGIDVARFEAARRAPDPSPSTRIVHVGRFSPVKGQDILLRALRMCRDQGLDIRCTLAGVRSDPDFFNELAALLDALDLKDHVRFELDRTDMETLLPGHDLFVLPSREEGFGLATIEAMAAGLPVIAAATGGVNDIVRHDENGLLFAPGDAQDLAAKLADAVSGRERLARFVETGTKTARGYDIRRTLERSAALYRALVSGVALPLAARAVSGAQGVDASAFREMP